MATSSQPKNIALAGDSTAFVVEIGSIEGFRDNQRVFDQKPSFTPSAIAASGSVVAVGGEVGFLRPSFDSGLTSLQDQKVHLNEWDGKSFKELVVLEGNKTLITALAFSPDNNLLASGDVSFSFTSLPMLTDINLLFRLTVKRPDLSI